MEKQKRMTQAQARAIVVALGLSFRKTEDGEFRVNFRGGSEASACYDSDLESIVGSAKDMANWKAARECGMTPSLRSHYSN